MKDALRKANIPETAELVFEGIRCRIYQWPQKIFDGTVKTFEKTARIPAATVVAIWDGKIVVLEQQQPHREPFISLPGGHANSWDEPFIEIAKRELLEETGLRSGDWQLAIDLSRYDFNIFEHHLYLALNCRKVAEPELDQGEKISTKLVDAIEFKEIIEDPRWRHVDLTAYLNKAGNFDKLIAQTKEIKP